jgi:hypothetical protein
MWWGWRAAIVVVFEFARGVSAVTVLTATHNYLIPSPLDNPNHCHRLILVEKAIPIYHQPLYPLLILGLKHFAILLSPTYPVLVA